MQEIQQREQKQDVVEAEQQVFDAKGEIGQGRRGRRIVDGEYRRAWAQHAEEARAVGEFDVQHHVRQGARQAIDGDAAAMQSARTVQLEAVDERGPGDRRQAAVAGGAVAWEDRRKRQFQAANEGHLPEHVVVLFGDGGDAQIGGADFVGGGTDAAKHGAEEHHRAQ